MTLEYNGWACGEGCCLIIRDKEFRFPVGESPQVVRPMYELISECPSGTEYYEYAEKVEDWDFTRQPPAGFQPKDASLAILRAMITA